MASSIWKRGKRKSHEQGENGRRQREERRAQQKKENKHMIRRHMKKSRQERSMACAGLRHASERQEHEYRQK